MEILFIIIIWFAVFLAGLLTVYFFIILRKKSGTKKKLKDIDKESRLLAIDELRRMIKRDPNNYSAREKLAEYLVEKKSYLPAIKEYLIIIDRDNKLTKENESKFLNKIGEIYQKLGSFEEAKKYFLICLSKDNYNKDANIQLGNMFLAEKNYEKAAYYYDIVSKIEPENKEIIKSYGICNYMMRNYKSVIDKLSMLAEEQKDMPDYDIFYYLGHSYYNLHLIDDALRYFSKLKQYPKYSTESNIILGKLHKDKGGFTKAIEDFENALVTGEIKDPKTLVEVNYEIADCYLKSQNIQKALEHWNKVYSIAPNYKDVLTKIQNFQEISKSQLLEIYLVGSVNQFTKICKLFVKYYISHYSSLKGNVKFMDLKMNPDATLEILAEVTSGNFIEQYYFIFMRSATTVGDMAVRNFYNTLKEQKADKGICITAGSFSVSAKEFVESRMIKIIERPRLVDILDKINNQIRQKSS